MITPQGNVVVGKKGRSGRKSAPEEFAKKEAIIKAWNKINKEIDDKDVKEVALPIALRTMTDKQDITSGGEPIEGFNFVKNETNNSTNSKTTASVG